MTDYFTRTPRKLSPFRSFASIELFHFRIPEDTLVAVWNLITFKEQGGTFGDRCPDRSVTVWVLGWGGAGAWTPVPGFLWGGAQLGWHIGSVVQVLAPFWGHVGLPQGCEAPRSHLP